ncbi:iron-containing alcohol dehydrogenase, partial [Candidatus Poribacteria bacterium]|nr:iron-containing alcohol dehydrogenase [Candidatus Poribacteria bacterium]
MNNITNYKYHNPVKISFGPGTCVEAIKDIIGKESYIVEVFYEKTVMDKLEVIWEIEEALPNCEIIKHSEMKSNPEINDLKAFMNNRNDLGDWIIGIGGGSTMDFAKSVAFLSPQEFSLEHILKKKSVDPVA